MQRTFDTPAPLSLRLELGRGQLTSEATDTDKTVVEITGPHAEEFHVELTRNTLWVMPPRGSFRLLGHDKHDVRVLAPRGSSLVAKVGSADAHAAGEYAEVRIKSGSGDVRLDRSTDNVVLDTGSGSIRSGDVAGDLLAKTGSGDIVVGDVGGDSIVSTGSGDITVGMLSGQARLKTGSGETVVAATNGDVAFSTGSGGLRVGHARRGRIDGKSGSGDFEIDVPAGTPVWTEVSTATGVVRSELRSLGAPADGQDHVELRLRTGSGDITLRHV